MRTIVIHGGPVEHALALTSLISGLFRQHGNHTIEWVTTPKNAVFVKHTPRIIVHDINHFHPPTDEPYDLCINYGGSAEALTVSNGINAVQYCGAHNVETLMAPTAFESLYGRLPTKQNLFQVLYQIADLKWRGEGYSFRYYPRARTKNDYVGVAVRNDSVRAYLKSNLEVVERRLWHVPLKEDPLKQFDEVNKVESVITDDPLVMHVAVALRKHVEYLTYSTPNIRPEFFGSGTVHEVPSEIAGPALPIT